MCSFLSYNFDVTEKLEHLNFFTQKRGPDNTTTYKRGNHLFVHNLLSITGDFTKQPFYDERCVVLFNGEIYSHSTFGGLFPKNLKDVFPWNSFYDSAQYSYLGKEENVSGAFGIEGRYL